MTASAPIGLYDSGLGGLSVARELFLQLPREAMAYFGDTARAPYGNRAPAELIAFNREILRILLDSGVKALVVACNTSSALALPILEAEVPVPILGILEAGARAAMRQGRRIGVIATEATTRSGAYVRAIGREGALEALFPLACPQLVPMIEAGTWQGPRAERIVRESLQPLVDARLDTLVLGCTHYPFVAPLIAEVLGPSVRLVDPAREAIRELGLVLEAHHLEAGCDAPQHRVMVSGDPASFDRLATRLLGPGLPAAVAQAVALPV